MNNPVTLELDARTETQHKLTHNAPKVKVPGIGSGKEVRGVSPKGFIRETAVGKGEETCPYFLKRGVSGRLGDQRSHSRSRDGGGGGEKSSPGGFSDAQRRRGRERFLRGRGERRERGNRRED